MKNKVALITGVNGQDGSYLAELLLRKGYVVHGIRRYSSTNSLVNLKEIIKKKKFSKKFHLHYGDITDTDSIYQIIKKSKPTEVYNLAAQSHVHVSFQIPEYTSQVDGVSQLRILEVVKEIDPKIKIYQAATSELYGDTKLKFLDETSGFNPVSPYSVSKLFGFYISKVYRSAYDMFICNGILFNHESPRRGKSFVTRKITSSVVDIVNGSGEILKIGNLNAKRDWGYAKEYVVTMWKMLQQKKPDDYVISTGKQYSVRQFIEESFNYFGIKILWKGKGLNEIGYDKKTKKILVKIDPYYFRPNEVPNLKGNSKKAKKVLGWSPKTDFKELVKIMIKAELDK